MAVNHGVAGSKIRAKVLPRARGGSSGGEQPAEDRCVVGSNPTHPIKSRKGNIGYGKDKKRTDKEACT